MGQLLAHDSDKEGTLNAQLAYTIVSQTPSTESNTFVIDESSGSIKSLRILRRKEHQVYNLNVRVSDSGDTHVETRLYGRTVLQNQVLIWDYGS